MSARSSNNEQNFQKISNFEKSPQLSEDQCKFKVNNYSIFRRLGTVLLHFSRRSTIHGLNHLAQARSAKHRLFWLTISCSASLGFCVNLFYLIEKFLQTPVLTNVFHDYNNFSYPDLSICIVNPIYFPPKNTHNRNELIATIEEYYRLTNVSLHNGTKINYNFNLQQIELSDYLFMHSKLEYSHTSWSAIILCQYLKKKCNYTHFETRHIWPYGNCFTFNGTKMGFNGIRDIKKNTIFNGGRPDFKLVIYKALEYPENLQIDPFNDINKPSGVLVMIHEPNTYPHIGESFVVDSFTQVDLKITTKSHLSSLNKCVAHRNNYTYYDFKSNTSNIFVGRQGDCLFSIIQTNIANYCGCQLHKMPILEKHRKLPFCYDKLFRNDNLTQCLHASLDDVDREQLRQLCYKDLCEHPSFSTVVSHSKYPAVRERQTHMLWLEHLKDLEALEIKNFGHSELINMAITQYNSSMRHNYKSIREIYQDGRTDLLNEKFINKNFMHLRFVPSSLFMDHVEETEEYPLSRLLSDIGGCVGLWVGASLITVFEFIDLLLDLSEIIRYRSQASTVYKQMCRNKKPTTDNVKHNSLVPNSYLNNKIPEYNIHIPVSYTCTIIESEENVEVPNDIFFNINTTTNGSTRSSMSIQYSNSSSTDSQVLLAETDIIMSV